MRNTTNATTTNNAFCISTQNVAVDAVGAWQDAARPFARHLASRPMSRGPKPHDLPLDKGKSDGDPSGRLSRRLGVRPRIRRSYRGVA